MNTGANPLAEMRQPKSRVGIYIRREFGRWTVRADMELADADNVFSSCDFVQRLNEREAVAVDA